MSSRLSSGVTIAVCGGILVIACSGTISDDVVVGEISAPPPSFVSPPDASVEASIRELTEYCPSNKCPTGFTTCPGSKFLCDADLRSDRNNCGACGVTCPGERGDERYDCVEGQCVLRCTERNFVADCDGIVDNGCETSLKTNENCGACGKTCADPETAPCLMDTGTPECGCPTPYTYCKPAKARDQACFDVEFSSAHCGGCGNVCDRAGAPGSPPPPPNAYYGCILGQCNWLKCEKGHADCNGDLNKPNSDGCEVSLGTNENCTACDDNCPAKKMVCGVDLGSGLALTPRCVCPPGQTFCAMYAVEPPWGVCADFTSDPYNCGGCGRVCPEATERSRGSCEYGVCKRECGARWADCNGNVDDDCEVDIFSDPLNCGGCGVTCDIAAGQACAGGRCVVEPCSKEEEEAR